MAGGFAGVISRTAIAPIERVKILYQINKGTAESGLAVAKGIWRNEGLSAFWKGNSAAVVRVIGRGFLRCVCTARQFSRRSP